MGPLSLEDIRAWLNKAMAGLTQSCGFPLGSGTFRESLQLRFLGRRNTGEQCVSVDVQGWGYGVMAVGYSRRGMALVNQLILQGLEQKTEKFL